MSGPTPAQEGFTARAARFKVTLDALEIAEFREAHGLTVQLEVLEHPEGGVNERMHKLIGPARWTPIVLAKGSTSSKDLWNWVQANRDGAVERKCGSIIALDQQGNQICRWDFRDAWPSSYRGPSFDYMAQDLGIERVELSHRGFDLKVDE